MDLLPTALLRLRITPWSHGYSLDEVVYGRPYRGPPCCGAVPLSVMDGHSWQVSPLCQGDFKPLCSFLGQQKETFLSLVNHSLSLFSWCKPDLQSIGLGHGVTYYVNTSFIEVVKSVIQNRMVLDMLTAAQGGTCAIIKAECCVYILDLSGNVSATVLLLLSHFSRV